MTTSLAQPAGLADPQPQGSSLDMAKQRLDEVRQGISHVSPLSKLVSSTKQLRKERQAIRSKATNLLAAIQDTTTPTPL